MAKTKMTTFHENKRLYSYLLLTAESRAVVFRR